MIPLKNIILVKPCESDNISEGGIYVPDSIKERSCKANVVAVGNKTKLKAGFTIWHIKDAGDAVVENGEIFYLMPDNEVLGYIEN